MNQQEETIKELEEMRNWFSEQEGEKNTLLIEKRWGRNWFMPHRYCDIYKQKARVYHDQIVICPLVGKLIEDNGEYYCDAHCLDNLAYKLYASSSWQDAVMYSQLMIDTIKKDGNLEDD